MSASRLRLSRIASALVAASLLSGATAGAGQTTRRAVTTATGSLGAYTVLNTNANGGAIQGEIGPQADTQVPTPFGVLGVYDPPANQAPQTEFGGVGVIGVSAAGAAVGAQSLGGGPAIEALSSGGFDGIDIQGSGSFGITSYTPNGFGGIIAESDAPGIYGPASFYGSSALVGQTFGSGKRGGAVGYDYGPHEAVTDKAAGVVAVSAANDALFAYGLQTYGIQAYGGLAGVDALTTAQSNVGEGMLALKTGEGVVAIGGNGVHPALAVQGTSTADLLDASETSSGTPTTSFEVQGASANRSGLVSTTTAASDVQVQGDVYVTGNIYVRCSGFPAAPTTACATPANLTTASTAVQAGGARSFDARERSWAEDAGEARLVNGYAHVPLDPQFAQSISSTRSYMVFTTPDGDVRGLFVTRKTPAGFDVREAGGGHSNIAFDYRIMAHPLALTIAAPVAFNNETLRYGTHHAPRPNDFLRPASLGEHIRMQRLIAPADVERLSRTALAARKRFGP